MTLTKQNAGQQIARIHANNLLAASARQMYDANLETVPKDTRISCAFVSGYNALQAIQPPYPGSPDDHPLISMVTDGAAICRLSKSDLALGLRLLAWEDYGRYHFEPSPASVQEAIDWAGRVRDAVLKHRATKSAV